MNRRAFSLVELIIAIFILGIGMISIAALFPAGIKQQEIAEDDVYGPLVAKHAMELLRTRLKQEDFGSFEEFSGKSGFNEVTVCDPVPLNALLSQYVSDKAYTPTIPKDWIWKRPGFIAVDDPSTTGCDEVGMYDIFSYYLTRKMIGVPRSTTPNLLPPSFTTDKLLSDITIGSTIGNRLYGIPYNRAIYDQQNNVAKSNYAWIFADKSVPISGAAPTASTNTGNALREPAVFITQRERYWPMPANAVGVTPTPKYVWDCMFRRFNGRILVGMFVYRVLPANGLRGGNYADNNNQTMGTPYVSAQLNSAIDPTFQDLITNSLLKYPPIPQWVSSRSTMKNLVLNEGDSAGNGINDPNSTKWGAGGLDGIVGSTKDSWKQLYGPNRDDCGVPGTGPKTSDPPKALNYFETWQQPGQWMIDQYNNVHHVIEGRRTHDDGPVILAKPIPRQPYSNALFDAPNTTERNKYTSVNIIITPNSPDSALLATPGSGGDALLGIQDLWFVPPYDANGNQLIPVFACVEEL